MKLDIRKLEQDLLRDEGVVLHEYKDHLGYSTIGVGRLIDKRRGGGITEDEAMYLLENDINRIVVELRGKLFFFDRLTEARKRALCNMCFQLGINGLMRFRKMIRAMSDGDYDKAYMEALDSKWAEQTPVRARRVAKLIRDGK